MLTLLTMTGCRPLAFELCQRWMRQQDFNGPVRWIIVDDGEQAQPVKFRRPNWTVEIVRPEPFWRPGQNTQARNILAGLELLSPDDRLVIIEDDDYYAPGYLTMANLWLDHTDLAGEALARYYHVGQRLYFNCNNVQHASLCSTAMKGEAIEKLKYVCLNRVDFIDMTLWRTFTGTRQLYSSRLCVGIKGLPGRAGIGVGHRMQSGRNQIHADPNGYVLQEWIGPDWINYEGLYQCQSA